MAGHAGGGLPVMFWIMDIVRQDSAGPVAHLVMPFAVCQRIQCDREDEEHVHSSLEGRILECGYVQVHRRLGGGHSLNSPMKG